MGLGDWLRKTVRKVRGRDIYLRDVYILYADKCNARCSMCEDDFYNHSGRIITLEQFKTIAANLHLEKLKSVVLAGGEPLLNRELPQTLDFINRQYPNIDVAICTNAIALTERMAAELLKRRVHSVNVSLNAASRQVYELVMQVDKFENVVENIRRFNNMRPAAGQRPAVSLSFAASRKNIGDITAYIELAASLGVDNVSATYCRFFPIEHRRSLAIDAAHMLQDEDSLYYHQELSDAAFQEADALAARLGVAFTREPLFSERSLPQLCRYPFTSVLIGFEGEVYPCCGGDSVFKPKIANGTYDFGNALQQPLEAFWNNPCFKAARYSALNPENVTVPECGVCLDIMKWKGNIEAAHILEWEDLPDQKIKH